MLLLYRAAESHPEYKCYFGLAKSRDGFHFERVSDEPVLSPSEDGYDASTIQDPRMVKMGEYFYVTYAFRHYPFGQFWVPASERYYSTAASGRISSLLTQECDAHRPVTDQGLSVPGFAPAV